MLHCFLDHVAIIFADLTWFNVFSTFVSFVAVIATIWVTRLARNEKRIDIGLSRNDSEADDSEELPKFGFQAQFKVAKQKLIEKELTAEQRAEEKQLESKALQAVMKLLQERNDIFSCPTMDDLQAQLSLYKAQ